MGWHGNFEVRFLDETGWDGKVEYILWTGRDGNFQREMFSCRNGMVISSGKCFLHGKGWFSAVYVNFLDGMGW